MIEVSRIAEMRAESAEAVRAGRRVGFVPTMGYLHAGHLSLVAEAKRRADLAALSIFVNPLQFAPNEDLATYPRDLDRDRSLSRAAGVDVLWTPATEDVYPAGPSITVSPGPVGGILEGAVRPGHFAGVLTVVLKLFNVVRPAVAVFGRKDAQQAFLVGAMVRELDVPVEIVVAPTVRDADGLALSSRNVYLTPEMRETALALPRALAAGVRAFRAGERRAGQVVAAAYRELAALERAGSLTVEYISVLDAGDFQPNHAATPASTLAAAIRVGSKRLLDNVVLGQGLEADPRTGATAPGAALASGAEA